MSCSGDNLIKPWRQIFQTIVVAHPARRVQESIKMFKLFVFAALCAFAAAGYAPLAIHAPLAYSAPLTYAAPLAYSAHVAAPVARIAAPIAYAAPTTVHTGAIVDVKSEPVEYHGYRISY